MLKGAKDETLGSHARAPWDAHELAPLSSQAERGHDGRRRKK